MDCWVELGTGNNDWNHLQDIIIESFVDDPWMLSECIDKKGIREHLSKVLPKLYEKYLKGDSGDFAMIKTKQNNKEKVIGGVCTTYYTKPGSTKGDVDWDEMSPTERHHDLVGKIVATPLKIIADRYHRELWYAFKEVIVPNFQGKGVGKRAMLKVWDDGIKSLIEKRNLSKRPIIFGMSNNKSAQRFLERLGLVIVGNVKFFLGSKIMEYHILIMPVGDETAQIVADARQIFDYKC